MILTEKTVRELLSYCSEKEFSKEEIENIIEELNGESITESLIIEILDLMD